VELRKAPKWDPSIDVVGKVKANVERDQKEPSEHMLVNAVCGAALVGIGGHASVFSY